MGRLKSGLLAMAATGLSGCAWLQTDTAGTASIERGRYLVQVAGCNDCHTPGYMVNAGAVAEEQWLTGESFGWNGPWGTTYATNLRLRMQDFDSAGWVTYAQNLKARPPMPWFSLNKLSESDLLAIYDYIRAQGPAGRPAPVALPPGQQPPPPFAVFPGPPPS